ncbi:type 1 glutamine amidotransferase domain-containing protein [Caulobacter endophyticus]|uniref:Type 1 glutamine amidotransferase domain-containing protein n=2 Tax=Caulobacter endophyticus TaxID=2172652 RepID=A0A2T9JYB2_9CAUL|nr:type 1 glutamine amidotransferase domain-containing protein [Caulobacter endophyticus]
MAAALELAAANPKIAPPSPKPVLIVVTSHGQKGPGGAPTGYFLSEVTHPLAVFEAAKIPVEFASIQGGEPPVDGLELDDPVNARYWKSEGFRASMRMTMRLEAVDPGRYAAVFFAGGHGAMWDFPGDGAVQRVASAVYEQGGVVSAVCHGPAALVDVRLTGGDYLVAGKKLAAFTDSEERAVGLDATVPFLLASKLKSRGALHQTGPDWTAKVVVDGKLVTGQNPQSATGVAEAVRDLVLAGR